QDPHGRVQHRRLVGERPTCRSGDLGGVNLVDCWSLQKSRHSKAPRRHRYFPRARGLNAYHSDGLFPEDSTKESVRMLSRILVPRDGSPAMEAILPTVRYLLGGPGAVVHLLALRPSVRELAREEDHLRTVDLDDVLLAGVVGWMPPAAGPRRSLVTRLREEQ